MSQTNCACAMEKLACAIWSGPACIYCKPYLQRIQTASESTGKLFQRSTFAALEYKSRSRKANWHIGAVPGARVIPFVSKIEALEPGVSFIGVCRSLVCRDHTADHGVLRGVCSTASAQERQEEVFRLTPSVRRSCIILSFLAVSGRATWWRPSSTGRASRFGASGIAGARATVVMLSNQ